jgi:integration host factor subunit beta
LKRARRLPTYTKRDLVRKLARERGVTSGEAARWVDALFAALREVLVSADPELRIEVREFGVFEVKRTKAKPAARNPRSGERIRVPARRKTHFKPGKFLKKFLSQPLDGDRPGPTPKGKP